jgi:uncharacterized protein (DUF885 family)
MMKSLLDEDLDASFRKNPIGATIRGVPGYNHLLPDVSLELLAKERERERNVLAQLKGFGAGALRGQDRISYDILFDKMELAVEGTVSRRGWARAQHARRTADLSSRARPRSRPFGTVEDYRDYVKRIQAMPGWSRARSSGWSSGLKSGWVHPKPVLDRCPEGDRRAPR